MSKKAICSRRDCCHRGFIEMVTDVSTTLPDLRTAAVDPDAIRDVSSPKQYAHQKPRICSARIRRGGRTRLRVSRQRKEGILSPWPLERPGEWTELVNEPLDPVQRQRIKSSLERGRPLGEPQWAQSIARRLGLQFTLNPRGRPPKKAKAKAKTEK